MFAAVGVRIIEPFYSKTIDKKSTHSTLKEYYTVLHSDLGKEADDSFFTLVEPVLESESNELFSKVVGSYSEVVVEAIRSGAKENMEDAVKLLNLCLPELKTVLGRQR